VTEETKQKKNERPTLKSGGTTREWVISTLAGMVSGLVAAGAAIRREFNDEVKSLPGMADYVDSKGKNQPGLTTTHTSDLIKADLEFKGQPDKSSLLQKRIRELKSLHVQDKINLFEKDYGIASSGIGGITKGSYQRLMRLGGSNIGEVLFKGASIAIVVGVGVYNLLTSIATRKKTREIEDLILDKVLEEPAIKMETAHRALHAEPSSKVSQVERHDRLQVTNSPALASSA